ncbi:unnamed protein product [Brachionus calyciflorus]|uniref:Peroxisome assembly protein 12 n=1 Tax=Brachionus calyciflorus TaxID=104777 RepID=A0A813M1R5_9BILA|nr:unnamed protein product [Brachionus calyciflorus]
MSSSQNVDYASILSKEGQSNTILRPSIFDIIAQENMHSLFRLSFNHFLKWISVKSLLLQKLKKYSDEIYLLLHSAMEFLYLKTYDGLFSEHFYNLKRDCLNNKKRVLSILLSIIIPYLKAKLDNFYEELEKNLDTQVESSTSNQDSKIFKLLSLIKKLILKYYPYFHLIWSTIFWLYRFRFMIKSSDFHSPLLSLIGVKLIYDINQKNERPNSVLKTLLSTFNNCLSNTLYFIQFLKWYQDYRDNQTYSNEIDLFTMPLKNGEIDDDGDDNLVPPPILPEKISQNKFFKNLNNQSLCPLCTKKRSNDCVLGVSGFVFCYPCIFKFIRAHNRCPLTNYPCTTKDIIRIYNSE